MKLFGLFKKEKPVAFPQFRDQVKLTLRRSYEDVKMENTENGFVLTLGGKPIACNLRNLYADYCKAPGDRDALIKTWIQSVDPAVPEHSWTEARGTLRPTLKSNEFIAAARTQMLKSRTPGNLPSMPFVGDLSVIVMRDLPGTMVAVIDSNLEAWGVTFEEMMRESINNMNMLGFPPVINSFSPSGSMQKGASGAEVGLVFHGDHLTATWLIMDRFRDHISMRLQGNYVVFVPNRSQLLAVRSDEPGLITSIQQSNRNYRNQAHWLTDQIYHIDSGTTGGLVSVYKPGVISGVALDPLSPFALNKPAAPEAAPSGPSAVPTGATLNTQRNTDLTGWWGLSEPTGDDSDTAPTPWDRGKK